MISAYGFLIPKSANSLIKTTRTITQCLVACLPLLTTGSLAAATFHVSPTGNDANDGSAKSPFATLEAARDAIRAKGADKGATVYLQSGRYLREQPFVLEPQDSGTKDHPVIY